MVFIFLDENVPHLKPEDLASSGLVENFDLKIIPHPALFSANATMDITVLLGIRRRIHFNRFNIKPFTLKGRLPFFIFLTFDLNFINDARDDLDFMASHPRAKTARYYQQLKSKIGFEPDRGLVWFKDHRPIKLDVLGIKRDSSDRRRGLVVKIANSLKSYLDVL